MNLLIAGLILCVAGACAVSGLLFLPLAALAESLPSRRTGIQGALWAAGLLLPNVLAAAAVVFALRLHALDPVPWPVRAQTVRHLSFWWIAEAPDAAYRLHFVAAVAAAALLAGCLRPAVSLVLAWRHARLLMRASTEVSELGVWLTPLARPWSTCAGLWRGRIYVTEGLAKLLTPDELQAVIAHEGAHARRHDNLRLLLAQAAFGPAAIMPTAHYFYRRFRASVECAADDLALKGDADPETLAAALVKTGRRLRDFSGDPQEEPLRRRLADRYREQFVAERAERLLGRTDRREGWPRVSGILVAALLLGALLVLGADLAAPTVRSLFESLLAALGGDG